MEFARDPSTIDFTFENGNPSMAGKVEIVAIDAQSVKNSSHFIQQISGVTLLMLEFSYVNINLYYKEICKKFQNENAVFL